MAIAVTEVGKTNTGDDASSVAVTSVALVAGRIYLALIATAGAGSAASVTGVTGTGLTMEKVTTSGDAENDIDSGNRRIEAWIGKCTASGTVTVTAALDDTSEISDVAIYELAGADNATATACILQAICTTTASGGGPGTTLGFSLSSFANSKNRPLAFAMHDRNEATTHDAGDGYTELTDVGHNDPQTAFCVQWHASSENTTPDFSWGASSEYGGFAFEIAVMPETSIAALLPAPRKPARKAAPPRRRLEFAQWFPFPPAQSLGVVSWAQWSREVELVEGDEIRITIAGPAADQPQVRLTLGGKQIY